MAPASARGRFPPSAAWVFSIGCYRLDAALRPSSEEYDARSPSGRAPPGPRVARLQHRGDLGAVEPARVLELHAVDRDRPRGGAWRGSRSSARTGTARAARRHRRPRRIRRRPPRGFRADRLFDRLAGFEKAGEARIHALGKARLAAEQAVLAIDREHDDDRIGARKMLRLAGVALAPPARRGDARRRAAIGAMAVAGVPMEDRLGLPEDGERRRARPGLARRSSADRRVPGRPGRERSACAGRRSRRCDRRFPRPRRRRAARRRPARRAPSTPSSASKRAPPSAATVHKREQRLARRPAPRQNRHVARDQRRARVGSLAQGRDGRPHPRACRKAVERRAGETEGERARGSLEKGVFHASSLAPPAPRRALAKRRKAGLNRRRITARQSNGKASLMGFTMTRRGALKWRRRGSSPPAASARRAPSPKTRSRPTASPRSAISRFPRISSISPTSTPTRRRAACCRCRSPPPAATRISTPSTR